LAGTLAETATGEGGPGFFPEISPRIGEWQRFRATSCSGGASVEMVAPLPLGIYDNGANATESRVFFDDGTGAGGRVLLQDPEARIECEMRARVGAFIPLGGTELLEVALFPGRGPTVGECDGERLTIVGNLTFDTPRTLTVTWLP
jgi:hypothetical protein